MYISVTWFRRSYNINTKKQVHNFHRKSVNDGTHNKKRENFIVFVLLVIKPSNQ